MVAVADHRSTWQTSRNTNTVPEVAETILSVGQALVRFVGEANAPDDLTRLHSGHPFGSISVRQLPFAKRYEALIQG